MISSRVRDNISRALWVVAVITVTFWVVWYTDRSLLASNHRPAYYEFENAFPAADGWLAFTCTAAALTLRRHVSSALLWLIAASSSALYLAGMDVLYDLEHAIWWRSGAGGLIEAVINAVCLLGGTWLMRWTWSHRAGLLNAAPNAGLPPG